MTLWTGSGLFNIELGQVIMIAVGLLLLFLAIRKGFEPLLLVPIGFGGILANIPEAGLALSAAENAIHMAKPEVLAALAGTLDVGYQATQAVTPEVMDTFKHAYKEASSAQVAMANGLASDYGYGHGMLYNFYQVVIGSTVGPLLIFMGVGAMTDFGPLLANPKTLLLGAAAQFGIFGTCLARPCWTGPECWTSTSWKLPPLASSVVLTARPPSTCPVFWRRTCWVPLRHGLRLHGHGADDPAADHEGPTSRKSARSR